MYVIGTAGHVDHGKSTLVRALTGIDPDRLPEEKRRQMTLDLGFAWFTLPSGREVSIVDVPGHEKFVRTMIAGAAGIDVALLVIAADRGVMQQTREHLAILSLLRVNRGIVVITKKELVDDEGLELARMEAEEAVNASSLKGAPIVAVSAETGEGLKDLTLAIDRLLIDTPQRRDTGHPRLPIDRIFLIKGFGTVVTGTLIDGRLSVGDEVEVLPPGLRAQVRRLETHKQKLETAIPGSRVAVNLANVSPEKLERGMVLTSPGWLNSTSILDVTLQAVSDLPQEITHNLAVTFYSAASEVGAKVRLLDKEKLRANESGWAQIQLEGELVVNKGDYFIIRSPEGTLGGGEIIDAHPKRHRRFQGEVIQSLESRKGGTPETMLLATLETMGPSESSRLFRESHLDEKSYRESLRSLTSSGEVVVVGTLALNQLLYSRSQWGKLLDEVNSGLKGYHAQYPLRRGMPREELKSRLRVAAAHFDRLVEKLEGENIIVVVGTAVALSSFKIVLSPAQQSAVDGFLKVVNEGGFSPPSDMSLDIELLNVLIQEGKVVKVAEDVVFSSATYDEMVKRIKEYVRNHGKITVAEARDMFQNSRKYAVALMEYLDTAGITRRLGNERVLR
ncbi:MAG: selenocysteine-specific translation elongation factor [Chloroflexota bacterium]